MDGGFLPVHKQAHVNSNSGHYKQTNDRGCGRPSTPPFTCGAKRRKMNTAEHHGTSEHGEKALECFSYTKTTLSKETGDVLILYRRSISPISKKCPGFQRTAQDDLKTTFNNGASKDKMKTKRYCKLVKGNNEDAKFHLCYAAKARQIAIDVGMQQ